MSTEDDELNDARSLISKLEDSIRNCRHGGPSSAEENTPWFRQCNQLARWDPCPIDMHDTIASYGDDSHIARNLVATVSIIAERFQLCIGHVGSRRFFAALAVDAWMNEDFIYVRKFLLKSIILDFLQKSGANTVLQAIQDGNIHDRHSLFQLVKGVLQCQNQCLKSYLELCSDGACRCIGFSQMINDERESIFSSSQNREAAEAHRVERGQERLPLVLNSSSEYWIVKKKAQMYLKSKQLERAKATYLEAKAILERQGRKTLSYTKRICNLRSVMIRLLLIFP